VGDDPAFRHRTGAAGVRPSTGYGGGAGDAGCGKGGDGGVKLLRDGIAALLRGTENPKHFIHFPPASFQKHSTQNLTVSRTSPAPARGSNS